jgi:hypothetical protein
MSAGKENLLSSGSLAYSLKLLCFFEQSRNRFDGVQTNSESSGWVMIRSLPSGLRSTADRICSKKLICSVASSVSAPGLQLLIPKVGSVTRGNVSAINCRFIFSFNLGSLHHS